MQRLHLPDKAAETVADAAVTEDAGAAIEIAAEAETGIEVDVAEIEADVIEAIEAETEAVETESEPLVKRPTKETMESRRSSMFRKHSRSEIVAAMTKMSTRASDLVARM